VKRGPLIALALAAAVAGVWANRTFRERPVVVDPAAAAAAAEREAGYSVLLTGGEQALAKDQLGAAWLAYQAVPADTALAARREALKVACEQAAERRLASDGGTREFWGDVLTVLPHHPVALLMREYGATARKPERLRHPQEVPCCDGVESKWEQGDVVAAVDAIAACGKEGAMCQVIRADILSRVAEGQARVAKLDPARPKVTHTWDTFVAAQRAPADAEAIAVLEKQLEGWRTLRPDDAVGAALMLMAYDSKHPTAYRAYEELMNQGRLPVELGMKLMQKSPEDAKALFRYALLHAPSSSDHYRMAAKGLGATP
jgi:hypothetical protein